MISLLLLFALIALVVSFLCSMWEATLLSITPSYAQLKLQEGTATGKRLESFKKDIDRPLAAILTLNTIAHTAGAIGVGQQATLLWEETHPFLTSVAVPVAMTLAILILSEIVPKTLGANYWQELAPLTVQSLEAVIVGLYPLVWLSQKITKALKKDKSRSVFSRVEFLAMAEIGVTEGTFERHESDLLKNLLLFNTVQVRDVMTPRTVVKTASEETTLQEFYEANKNLRFSRIPIHRGVDTEHIHGYVLKDELLSGLVQGKGEETLGSLEREILIVHESFPIPDLFNRFLLKREHIALVVDEFGGMAGIVTMEDVIETLLGMEIVDEYDGAADMQALARKNWERRAKRLGIIQEKEIPENDRDDSKRI